MYRFLRAVAAAGLALGALACAGDERSGAARTPPVDAPPPAPARDAGTPGDPSAPPSVTVTLQPLGDSGVSGTVSFAAAAAGIEVRADVRGLSPGKHGFHVHEFGDCSAPDGGSAGPHFNPTAQPHGAPGAGSSHMGDFGNLDADAQGVAVLNFTLPGATLDQSKSGILGRSILVHRDPDDLTTQPSGNSGARIACGVILAPGSDAQPVKKM
jgi:Cu-Zn family superoxide dismutase